MKQYIKHSILNYDDYPNRVCLPYGSDLFDISRWILEENSSDFEIVVGSTFFKFNTRDLIEIYNSISDKCIGYILESSFIKNKKSGNLIYFDIHERFSFFAGDLQMINYLFPFHNFCLCKNLYRSGKVQ